MIKVEDQRHTTDETKRTDMTHLNATFIIISTDGENVFLGLSENGEVAVGNYDTRLDAVANIISYEAGFSNEAPVIVVVGKDKVRATAGEVFLEGFARSVVRKRAEQLPETAPVYVAGTLKKYTTRHYAPRVVSLPLVWATKSTPLKERVRRQLHILSQGDEGFALIPKGLTYVTR